MKKRDKINTCLFCSTRFKAKRKFWENAFFYAIFDNYPVSPGHSLIISQNHIPSLDSLSKDAWYSLQDAIHKVSSTIKETDLSAVYKRIIAENETEESVWFAKQALQNSKIMLKPDGYNYGINDGEVAGRTIAHLHVHIIPRHKGDVKDPRGGVRYVIPDMGNYKIKR